MIERLDSILSTRARLSLYGAAIVGSLVAAVAIAQESRGRGDAGSPDDSAGKSASAHAAPSDGGADGGQRGCGDWQDLSAYLRCPRPEDVR